MKIAIFHNYMDNIGGAEIVGLTLARELKADLYTTNVDQGMIDKMGFPDIKPISIGRLPINAPFRQQIALWRFRNLSLKNLYDFYLIDGDWAISGVMHNKPNLWYVHSPIREIWDLSEYTRENMVRPYMRKAFDVWVKYNRYLSRKYTRHVDAIVCNSANTQKRVKKYFSKDAQVIYPPIETAKFYYKQNGDFWLSVNRLITHKRVDIQIEAFRKLPNEKLLIVGSYEQSRHFQEYATFIKRSKPENIKIVSWVNFDELVELYATCRGFITTSKNEDFGMTAVEAMASGKPVIAPNEGGYKETMIDGVTGKLIDNINADKLASAVSELASSPEKYEDACRNQALKFDTKIFLKRIRKVINT